jgi:hypothetical protein
LFHGHWCEPHAVQGVCCECDVSTKGRRQTTLPTAKGKKPSKKCKATGDAETQELLPAEPEPEGDHFSRPEADNNHGAELGVDVQTLFNAQELPLGIQEDKCLNLPEVYSREKEVDKREGNNNEEHYGIGYMTD